MAEERVEAYVRLRESLSVAAAPRFPTREPVSTPGEAELAAERLRQEWALADLPVESVTELIERNEGIVVELPEAEEAVDGLAGLANGCHAVVVVDPSVTDDRRRVTLAHELGHLVMDTSAAATPKDEERLAHRFASAFLVPATVARRELGERRSHLTLQELGLLKIKHGLSMQAWLYRTRDMGIIDEPHFNSLFDQMSRQGWRRVEPVQYCTGREQPIRFRQMVLRALAEGTLEMEQARRWCPDMEWTPAGEEPSSSVAALRMLPAEQRDMLLARAARDIADAYHEGADLRGFDAPEVVDGDRP